MSDGFKQPSEAELNKIRDEWIAVQLSTEPADRERAEAGAKQAYEQAGVEWPGKTRWFDGPFAAAEYVAKESGMDVKSVLWQAVYGQHEAGWLGYYDALRKGGKKEAERLVGLMEVAKSCGWWWPTDVEVIFSERTASVSTDEEGRLHNDSGPAITWPNGEARYCWHGVLVDEQIIMHPDTLTPDQVNSEENQERRRIMIERMTPAKYLRESDAQLLDEKPDQFGRPRKLWKLEQAEGEDIVMVEVVNSTPEPIDAELDEAVRWIEDGRAYKRYWLRVPPNMTDANEAVAWTFDEPVESFEAVAES